MPLDYPARLLKASSNDSGHADIHSGNHAFSIGIIPESLSIASRFRYRHHPGILIAFIPERLSPCPGLRIPFIDAILEADRKAPRKQRHTARRIWQRIQEELPGCKICQRTVRQYVHNRKRALGFLERETYVPQSYDGA